MQHVEVHALEIQPDQRLQRQGSLGETLRFERKRRGVSLEEMHEVTKIKTDILLALEENNHDLLPAPIFVRGFIKAIAQYLELPEDDLLMIYHREGPQTPSKVMTNPTLLPSVPWWRRLWNRLIALFSRKRISD